MKRRINVVISLILSLIIAISVSTLAFAESDYRIVSPYDDVVWSGEGAWHAYKGNLHTHSFASDAQVDYRDMILEYYNQNYDFLAMTDHGVTGKSWNKLPTILPLYAYQYIIGNFVHYFNDEEFSALESGSFPVDGKARGFGMTCVPGGNELNALTITKDHVNALFLPSYAGNNYLGFENDYEGAVRLADHYGALSFINHPGDWLQSNKDRANCGDEEKISYIADILLRYDSCLGIEVFNEHNGTTGYDRDTWDNLLMKCLPYGKNIIAFSNGDTHYLKDVDSSYCVYMMPENNLENIKKTMQSGASFAVTRVIRADKEKFGPDENLEAWNTDKEIPMFSDIRVDGHKIIVSFNNAYNIKWVANKEVIADKNINESADSCVYELNLDDYENAGDYLYVRCQLLGSGGITLTQTFVIDNGKEPPKYERDNSFSAIAKRLYRQLLGTRFFVIINLLVSLITKK